MNMYFNGRNTENFGVDGLKIAIMNIYDSAIVNKKIEAVEIDGMDGSYTIDKGLRDREIELKINIMNSTNIRNSIRIINDWLLDIKDNRLQFEDDMNIYYEVKTVEISNFQFETVDFLAVFTAKFTLNPYVKLVSNPPIKIDKLGAIRNNYCLSKPTYKITGEGYLTLKINDKNLHVNLGQDLIIDTEFQECYRDGIQQVNVLEGNYEDMWLQEGNNTISYSGGTVTKFEIVPNWRML